MSNSFVQKRMFKHYEAFLIMNYACEKCGHHENIWNSRDGVTPFCIPCRECGAGDGMIHVNWDLDRFDIFYKPRSGERYFADMTTERARELAVRNVDYYVSKGLIPQNDRNNQIVLLTKSYYDIGVTPDILEQP